MNKYFYSVLAILLLFQIPSFSQEIPLTFQPVKDQPFLLSQDITADTAEYDTLTFTLKAKENGTGRLFWAISLDPKFDQIKSIWFYIKAGEHNYTFNIPSQNPNWVDWAKKFLIYPENGGQKIEVLSARITRSDLISNMASGWQEFWGPSGREDVGSTINLNPANTIHSIAINVYLYWLIGFGFLAIYATNLIKTLNMKNKKKTVDPTGKIFIAYKESMMPTLALALACWLFLALNSDHNYINLFKDNLSKYFGKTINEKRSVAYEKSYYDFLDFAQNNMPKEKTNFGIISSLSNPDLQARIFLVPHEYVDYVKKDPQYLLVFKPSTTQGIDQSKFTLLAKLHDNEYILKRK